MLALVAALSHAAAAHWYWTAHPKGCGASPTEQDISLFIAKSLHNGLSGGTSLLFVGVINKSQSGLCSRGSRGLPPPPGGQPDGLSHQTGFEELRRDSLISSP
jgi:hypothetical protein